MMQRWSISAENLKMLCIDIKSKIVMEMVKLTINIQYIGTKLSVLK